MCSHPPPPYTAPVGNYHCLALGEDPISPPRLTQHSVLTQAHTHTRQGNESHRGFENVSGISLFLFLDISWAQLCTVEEENEEALTGSHVQPYCFT